MVLLYYTILRSLRIIQSSWSQVYGSDSSWNRPLYAIWFGGRVNASLEYKMLTLPEIVLALPTLYVLFGGMGWCDIESDWCSTEFSHS